jgi:RHS repeat-associated protein
VGTHTLTAKATDNLGLATTSAAVSIRVDAPPSVSITSPANNASFNAPASVPITVNAQDTDGTINRVELYANSALIATLTVAPYSFNWTNVAAGTYALTAKAVDNNNAETLSAAVTITVRTGVAALYFIHSDHLNTPRLITDASQQVVWRWDQAEPFGVNVPDENPSGLGAFEFPMRLSRGYADKETGKVYTHFRDNSPDEGRFIQSDPIGLSGGLNTYAYVGSNPLSYIDPEGLKAVVCCRLLSSMVLGTVIRQRHCYLDVDGRTYGLYPEGNAGVPRINDPRDRGGNCKECGPLPCSDVSSCIRNQHDSYPIGDYSAAFGPNSNTYAGTIARACCKGGMPSGLGSAPSVGDDPPKQNPRGVK